MVEAMKKASHSMWEGQAGRSERFGALYRKPKWLNLTVPGDACNLDPGGFYDDKDPACGYTLEPHNVDGSLQQLTFLAGLAHLHGLVRAG